MARVEFTRRALDNLDRLIAVLSLPSNTRDRVRKSVSQLQDYPRIGKELPDRWEGARFVLGPWRWMLIIYRYVEDEDRVIIVTIQDARSSNAATTPQTERRKQRSRQQSTRPQ